MPRESRTKRATTRNRSKTRKSAPRGRAVRSGPRKAAATTPTARSLWRSRGTGVLLLIVAIFMSVSVVKELIRQVETRYEIDTLQSEVARLEDRNTEMSDLIALFNTSSTQDKQARVKLGLQSPGEQVVLLPDRQQDDTIILPDSDTITYVSGRGRQSNPERWKQFLEEKISKSE